MGHTTSRALLLSVWVVASGFGCAGNGGPLAHAGAVDQAKGTASGGTWLSLEARGAKLRAPEGWTWTRRGERFRAEAADKVAVIELAGADDRVQLANLLRTIGAEHGLDQIDLKKGRSTTVHGITSVIYEDMSAEASRVPVDVLTLVGDAPNGHGVVVVVVIANDASQKHDLALIDAANSLQPL